MIPSLWGPSVWEVLFSAAWSCRLEDQLHLWSFLQDDLKQLLPCPVCRTHYSLSKITLAAPALSKQGSVFEWLHKAKASINKRPASGLSLSMLITRHALYGASMLNVPRLADTLVLLALHAEEEGHEASFLSLCTVLCRCLALPSDSRLLYYLRGMSRPIASNALVLCQSVRAEHGMSRFPLTHYQSYLSGKVRRLL